MTPTRARTAAFAATLALALIDAAETGWALTRPDGAFTEVQPGAAHLLAAFGLPAMLAAGFAATCVAAGAFLVRPTSPTARAVLWGGAALIAAGKLWVVASNAWQLAA